MQIFSLDRHYYFQWDSYVDAHPRGRIYHKTVWKEIIERAFGKKTHYRFVIDDGRIVGILPLVHFHTYLAGKQLISLPYVNYGGPIWSGDKAKKLILDEIERLRKSTRSEAVEIRYDQAEAFPFPVRTNKVTFLLPLPDSEDELLKSFKAKLRSQIRRPTKEGMYGKSGHKELLNDFYYIFCRNMRDLGTPVYGKSFFEIILDLLPDQTRIIVVYTKESKPVAAAFLMGYKKTLEIPWASSLKAYNRFSPNMLLYWEVLRFAVKEGYKVFDFGRGTRDGGTHRFKKQWGGDETQLYWYYALEPGEELPEINKENPKFALAIKIWQKLPLWFTKAVGPKIVKNIP
ncbi:MAG: FemAB family PEP-CTERM system-associated protein [Calditrichaeota bacterium]|nr:FemAB family PEP-CTERM system-associated protein [Calditrichota bacterium]